MKKAKIPDTLLFCGVLILIIFSMVMLYSASSYSAFRDTGDAFFYLKKQLLAFVVGLFFMILLAYTNLKNLEKLSIPLLLLSYVLLALVFVPKIGVENYGAKRWINLGFTTFQPSEFAKFALVLFVATRLAKKSSNSFKNMLPIFIATAIMCALIMFEPNMSITMCVALVVFTMLVVGGMKFKHFLCLAIPAVIAVVALIVLEPYRMKRFMAFINPWENPLAEGYQLIQSYYALGSGGMFGVGLFNSRQKYLFLPFAESDFIFAIIGEELGLFGCLIFMALFCLIIYRGIVIAMQSQTRLNCYLATGITSVIAIQTIMNIAVVSGSMPPTGLPMPFVSAGGSSLMIFMSAIGILLNIARQNKTQFTYQKVSP